MSHDEVLVPPYFTFLMVCFPPWNRLSVRVEHDVYPLPFSVASRESGVFIKAFQVVTDFLCLSAFFMQLSWFWSVDLLTNVTSMRSCIYWVKHKFEGVVA